MVSVVILSFCCCCFSFPCPSWVSPVCVFVCLFEFHFQFFLLFEGCSSSFGVFTGPLCSFSHSLYSFPDWAAPCHIIPHPVCVCVCLCVSALLSMILTYPAKPNKGVSITKTVHVVESRLCLRFEINRFEQSTVTSQLSAKYQQILAFMWDLWLPLWVRWSKLFINCICQ